MAEFPFLYLNQGPLLLESMGKCDGAYVGFGAPVPEEMKKPLVAACPEPIRGFASFTGGLLAIESPGDVFDWTVLERYGTPEELDGSMKGGRANFGQETADRFSAAVEEWARAMHAMHPIVFFMGPCSAEGGDWDTWSRERFTRTVVPFLEALAAAHPELREPESYDEDELDYEDELDDVDATAELDMLVIQPLRHGHVACLLQEFEPAFEIAVPDEFQPALTKLLETFEL